MHAFADARHLTYYLVGGLIRDQLLGRSFMDPTTGAAARALNVDLAVARGAWQQARELAGHLAGSFVPLDEAQGIARVVVAPSEGASRVELDLCDFRGPTLEHDLARRDFTINAMAVALADWLKSPQTPAPLVDPLNGRQALAERQLLACFPGTFDEDPVRIVRAFRFAAQLGFTMPAGLQALMAQAVAGLARVAGERIREEFLAILGTDDAGESVAALGRLGALDVLFPELAQGRGVDQGDFHHLDVFEHQVEAVRQADGILASCEEFGEPLRQALRTYVAEAFVEGRSRKRLIKLSVLFHDVGKPANRQVHPDGEIWFIGHEHTGAQLMGPIAERLHLSNREARMVIELVRHHLRPGFLSREPELTRRAIYRFYKELADDGPACALAWWADRLATRGPRSRLDQLAQQRARLEEMLRPYFFKAEEIVRPPRLLDGHRVMDALRLPPGPRIGALLAVIEEAQAEGRIHTAEEALALARATLAARREEPDRS